MKHPMAFFARGIRTRFSRSVVGSDEAMQSDMMLLPLVHKLANSSPAFDDLILGCAYPEGEQGYNLARMVAVGAGLETPGCTINRLCASSLEAVAIAAGRVAAGWGECFLVGGVESMSRIPRRGANFFESEAIKSGCSTAYITNGETAENVASQFPQIDRAFQEDFAARSHELADQAWSDGKYDRQVNGDRDQCIRVPVNREKIASLKPAFRESGTVTAATSSPLTDGAACGIVVSEKRAGELQLESALEIVDVAVSHVAPEVMGLGPVPATEQIFKRNSIGPDDLAAVEINEAFAIQVLASLEKLTIPLAITNTWGGALAIGHPLGASGLRLIMTLHDRLDEADKPGSLGLATLCVGGGQGMSVLVRHVRF